MDNDKRLLLAIGLSIAVLFAYQGYASKFYKTTKEPLKSKPAPAIATPAATTEENPPPKIVPDDDQPGKTIMAENELYKAVLSEKTAAVESLSLVRFKDKSGNPLLISRAARTTTPLLFIEDTTARTQPRWSLAKEENDTALFMQENDSRRVYKRFKFHNSNYIIELQVKILNKTTGPQEIRYKITGGSGAISSGAVDERYIESEVEINNKIYKRRPAQRNLRGGEIFYGSPAWAALKSRYFSFILKPEQAESAAFVESPDRKNLISGIILGPITLGPNEETAHTFLLYAGPNSIENISALGASAERVVTYGVFNEIANLILKTLKLCYNLVGNYGVAIILLALAISLILFPLTRKSLRSMKEMQRIQPDVEKIRRECKENPQKMNKEIMELYKKHKINPLGGCLPMLLQLPIFIALYQALIRSVELKGACFLWIKDLSEPDAAFRLPASLPFLGDYINILPILMALAMAVQQKLSQGKTAGYSEQQRVMSLMMPILMGIIFYNLPSGLILYWVTNTVVMIILQEVVIKRPDREPASG